MIARVIYTYNWIQPRRDIGLYCTSPKLKVVDFLFILLWVVISIEMSTKVFIIQFVMSISIDLPKEFENISIFFFQIT